MVCFSPCYFDVHPSLCNYYIPSLLERTRPSPQDKFRLRMQWMLVVSLQKIVSLLVVHGVNRLCFSSNVSLCSTVLLVIPYRNFGLCWVCYAHDQLHMNRSRIIKWSMIVNSFFARYAAIIRDLRTPFSFVSYPTTCNPAGAEITLEIRFVLTLQLCSLAITYWIIVRSTHSGKYILSIFGVVGVIVVILLVYFLVLKPAAKWKDRSCNEIGMTNCARNQGTQFLNKFHDTIS